MSFPLYFVNVVNFVDWFFKHQIIFLFLQEIQFDHYVLTLKNSTWLQFVNIELQAIFSF